MRHIYLAIAALLCVSCAALAQDNPGAAGATSPHGERDPVVTTVGLQSFGRIVRNANDCAPGHPDAIWGASLTPVGYACTSSAN